MAKHRYHLPRQWVQQRENRDRHGGPLAAHHVVVAVRHDDHVACLGPVAHPVVDSDPARTGGDDVEQGQPIGTRDQRVGEGERARFELERLGELGTKEQCTLKA
jgi:hypothetical protein